MTNEFWKGLLLQLLLPGLGHIYVRERLFGLFVFLVMLLAALLFAASFFLDLPTAVRFVMLGLPILFYLFSFFELRKLTAEYTLRKQHPFTGYKYFLIAGIVYQLIAPVAVGNFLFINHPEIYRLETSGFAPELKRETVMYADNLEYQLRFLAVKKVILHALPDRYDIVRVADANGERHTGMVVGLPGEEIEITSGIVIINGTPQMLNPNSERLTFGNWPLTQAGNYTILVALMGTGTIDTVLEVPLDAKLGKVRPLL